MYDENSCESNRIQSLLETVCVVVKNMALESRVTGVNVGGFISYYLCNFGYLISLISLLICTMRTFFSQVVHRVKLVVCKTVNAVFDNIACIQYMLTVVKEGAIKLLCSALAFIHGVLSDDSLWISMNRTNIRGLCH